MNTMSAAGFAEAVGAQRYIAEMNAFDPRIGDAFVNTYAAKGPVFLVDGHDRPVYLLTDRKDSEYPNRGLRGKLVLKGGNWKEPGDWNPFAVWERQLAEETGKPVVRGIPSDADRRLREAILRNPTVFSDYFTAVPGIVLDNPALLQPWYCDVASVISARVRLDELDEVLGVPAAERDTEGYRARLNAVSTESPQWLTPVSELVDGTHVLFGFGDATKTADVLREWYSIRIAVRHVPGVEVVPLDTTGMLLFERRLWIPPYLRLDNNPLRAGKLEGGRVFMARDAPKE